MATIIPVARPTITPVPPLMEGQMAGLLEKWLPQLPTRLYKQRIDTQVSLFLNNTATTLLILPQSWGLWLVHVGISRVNDGVNYQAAALVFMDGVVGRMVNVLNAANQTITLSGMNVISTQISGGTQTGTATAVQLTNF